MCLLCAVDLAAQIGGYSRDGRALEGPCIVSQGTKRQKYKLNFTGIDLWVPDGDQWPDSAPSLEWDQFIYFFFLI